MTLLPREDTPFSVPPFAGDTDNPFVFSGSVGRFGDNDRADVIRAQILLGNAGYYDLPMPGVPTGWPGAGLERAISAYQKDRGLTPDGRILPLPPGGVDAAGRGETIAALQGDFGEGLDGYRVPQPEDVDRFYAIPQGNENSAPTWSAANSPASTSPNFVLADDAQRRGEPVGMLRTGKQSKQRLEQQYAQVALPIPTPPVATDAPLPHDRLPHERPDVKAAGAWLGKTFDDAAGRIGGAISTADQLLNTVGPLNLLTLPTQAAGRIAHTQASATPPSEPPDDKDREAGRTPPLEPPKVDADVKGRPAEAEMPAIESLIPPEMRDWYEGLEPFDQALARDLLAVLNRRGDEATQLGNTILAERYLKVFREEFADIRGQIEHVGGAKTEEDKNLPEEYLRNAETKGRLGSSWADVSLRFVNHVTESLRAADKTYKGDHNRINTTSMRKSNPDQPTALEDRNLEKMKINAKGGPVAGVPKLRADLPNGKVSEQAREAYGKAMEDFARKNIPLWLDHLVKTGLLR